MKQEIGRDGSTVKIVDNLSLGIFLESLFSTGSASGTEHADFLRDLQVRRRSESIFRRSDMKIFKDNRPLIAVVAMGWLVPAQAHATTQTSVPEPVSATLLAIGLAGFGGAELIRRRKDK
jgi:hypothetical protein